MTCEMVAAEGMSKTELNSVLRRKAQDGRDDHQARTMSPAKALRIAIAKAADDVFELDIVIGDVDVARVSKPDIANSFGDGDMLLLLEGQSGCTAALAMDRVVIAALIEKQTIGHVTQRTADDRRATRVDAAMVAPLVDRALGRFETLLADESEAVWACGYAFGAMVEDLRALDLALSAHEFHQFRLETALGGGAKKGRITLLLPDRVHPVRQDDVPEEEATDTPFLGDVVMQASAEIMAVLTRISLPVDELSALRPGQVLPLAPDALQHAALEAGQGQRVASVVLGQLNGFRAVRLRGSRRVPVDAEDLEALSGLSMSATAVEDQLQKLGKIDESVIEIPSDEELLAGMPGMAYVEGDAGPTAADLISDMNLEDADFAEIEDLSDLDDLPDLADLPGLVEPLPAEGQDG